MLLNWFRQRREARKRKIFRYWDGTQYRRIDPMSVYRTLALHAKFDINVHPQLAVSTSCTDIRMVYEAAGICCEAVRDAFGVRNYDDTTGTGLTELQQLELLGNFFEYNDGLKKSTSPSPMPLVATTLASLPPTVRSATKGSLDCGSINSESKCDAPLES